MQRVKAPRDDQRWEERSYEVRSVLLSMNGEGKWSGRYSHAGLFVVGL